MLQRGQLLRCVLLCALACVHCYEAASYNLLEDENSTTGNLTTAQTTTTRIATTTITVTTTTAQALRNLSCKLEKTIYVAMVLQLENITGGTMYEKAAQCYEKSFYNPRCNSNVVHIYPDGEHIQLYSNGPYIKCGPKCLICSCVTEATGGTETWSSMRDQFYSCIKAAHNTPATLGKCADPDPGALGTEDYSCPVGYHTKALATADAECTDVSTCNTNCCDSNTYSVAMSADRTVADCADAADGAVQVSSLEECEFAAKKMGMTFDAIFIMADTISGCLEPEGHGAGGGSGVIYFNTGGIRAAGQWVTSSGPWGRAVCKLQVNVVSTSNQATGSATTTTGSATATTTRATGSATGVAGAFMTTTTMAALQKIWVRGIIRIITTGVTEPQIQTTSKRALAKKIGVQEGMVMVNVLERRRLIASTRRLAGRFTILYQVMGTTAPQHQWWASLHINAMTMQTELVKQLKAVGIPDNIADAVSLTMTRELDTQDSQAQVDPCTAGSEASPRFDFRNKTRGCVREAVEMDTCQGFVEYGHMGSLGSCSGECADAKAYKDNTNYMYWVNCTDMIICIANLLLVGGIVFYNLVLAPYLVKGGATQESKYFIYLIVFVMAIVDVCLQVVALVLVFQTLPIVSKLEDANCLDRLHHLETEIAGTLAATISSLNNSKIVGIVELALGLGVVSGDACLMVHLKRASKNNTVEGQSPELTSRTDENKQTEVDGQMNIDGHQKVTSDGAPHRDVEKLEQAWSGYKFGQSILANVMLWPVVVCEMLDCVMSVIDFTFTETAREETIRLFDSIVGSGVWCFQRVVIASSSGCDNAVASAGVSVSFSSILLALVLLASFCRMR